MLINILTTIALAAHGVFGCCWHHPHDASHNCESHSHIALVDEHEGHHDHSSCDSETTHDDQDDSCPARPGCDHGRCVYVGVVKVIPAAPQGMPMSIADLDCPSAISGCAQTTMRPPIRTGDVKAANAPLFLRHQIWLI